MHHDHFIISAAKYQQTIHCHTYSHQLQVNNHPIHIEVSGNVQFLNDRWYYPVLKSPFCQLQYGEFL